MNLLLSVLLFNSLPADNKLDIVFAHPGAPISCPTFVKEEVVLPAPQQYRMCLAQIVRPLEVLCTQEGFKSSDCKERTMMWIIGERLKRIK